MLGDIIDKGPSPEDLGFVSNSLIQGAVPKCVGGTSVTGDQRQGAEGELGEPVEKAKYKNNSVLKREKKSVLQTQIPGILFFFLFT